MQQTVCCLSKMHLLKTEIYPLTAKDSMQEALIRDLWNVGLETLCGMQQQQNARS
jgi:hypothetical protein